MNYGVGQLCLPALGFFVASLLRMTVMDTLRLRHDPLHGRQGSPNTLHPSVDSRIRGNDTLFSGTTRAYLKDEALLQGKLLDTQDLTRD
jgi:hypothetical protein